MARAGFYNENEYRDYPFMSQASPPVVLRTNLPSSESASSNAADMLPHEAIVDFGAIMGIGVDFVEGASWVYLASIERRDPYIRFVFGSTSTTEVLVFDRHITNATPFEITWGTSWVHDGTPPWPGTPSSSSSQSLDPCEESDIEGYIVTSKFDDLLDLIADTEKLNFESTMWIIEPARIQSLARSFVRSFNLANRQRTLADPPERCRSSSSSVALEGDPLVWINTTCMQGNLEFKEGYNCSIRQEDGANTIVISGAPGRGGPTVGLNCDEFEVYTSEPLQPDSPYYTGGPTCGDIIKTINGKGGRRLRIHAGPGFRITQAEDDPSRLFIDATLDDFAICFAESSSLSSSSGGP